MSTNGPEKNAEDMLDNSQSNDACHRVPENDYRNMIYLVNILARQLELSIEDSVQDYQTITEYCMQISDAAHSEHGNGDYVSKARVIQALQYYDRCCQRISHVAQSMHQLARHLERDHWRDINMDLQGEIEKTHSFFDERQTRQLHEMVNRTGSEND